MHDSVLPMHALDALGYSAGPRATDALDALGYSAGPRGTEAAELDLERKARLPTSNPLRLGGAALVVWDPDLAASCLLGRHWPACADAGRWQADLGTFC